MHGVSDALVVDAVLLLPDFIREAAISLNRLLIARHPAGAIRLGRRKNLPHITVAMVGIGREDLPAIGRALLGAVQRFPPLHLTLTRVDLYQRASGGVLSSLQVRRDPLLQAFHETVMAAISPYAHLPVTAEMIADSGDEPLSEHILAYINRFLENSAFEHYTPHITLGMGVVEEGDATIPMPGDFTVHTAALCRVGNHGVCREVLSRYALGSVL